MSCKGCGRAWCRCRVDSTDCIKRSGSGNPGDSLRFDVVLDPAETNDIQETKDGLLLLPPVAVARPLAFFARFGEPGEDFDPLVSILPTATYIQKVVGYKEVIHDTGGLLDASSGVFTCPRAGVWELIGSADLLDDDVIFGFGLALNNQHSIAMSGPYQLTASPPWGNDNCITHEQLEVGDEVQLFISSSAEGVLINRSRFLGSFIGD